MVSDYSTGIPLMVSRQGLRVRFTLAVKTDVQASGPIRSAPYVFEPVKRTRQIALGTDWRSPSWN